MAEGGTRQERLKARLAEAEGVARAIAANLGAVMKEHCPGWGFALLLFTLGGGGHMTYVSNGKREDMVKALHELLDNLEGENGKDEGPEGPGGLAEDQLSSR